MIDERASWTAQTTAYFRARDAQRPESERILNDPWAACFLAPPLSWLLGAGRAWIGRAAIDRMGTQRMESYVLCRHRFIDDALDAALDGGIDHAVVLGAGYDSRAMRFAGRARFLELDFPSTQARKRALLAQAELADPADPERFVPIDFEKQAIPDALAGAGFVAGTPTFFAWEGVSMYLHEEAVSAVLNAVREVGGPGSRLALDFWWPSKGPDIASRVYDSARSTLSLLGEPIRFPLGPDELDGFAARHGFRVVDSAQGPELERRYGKAVYSSCHVALLAPVEPAA